LSAHIVIPNGIAETVHPRDLQVYCVIRRHLHHKTGVCNPSCSAIAAILNVSKDTVERSIARLGAGGWVIVIRKDGAANRYTFPDHNQPQPCGRSDAKPAATLRPLFPQPAANHTQNQPQFCARNKEELQSELQSIKPSTSSDADDRHAPVRQLIQRRHRETFGNVCEWNGREGSALQKLLKNNPAWGLVELLAMVENRFASEAIKPARPGIWIPHLGEYAAGPLDRYGNVWEDTRPRLQEGLKYRAEDDYVA